MGRLIKFIKVQWYLLWAVVMGVCVVANAWSISVIGITAINLISIILCTLVMMADISRYLKGK